MLTDTIFELVARNAEKHSDEIAIIGLSQQPITYVMLEKQILETITALQRHGIGSGDCIALVLPNGPMLAMAFIAIASFTQCAPLNPALTEQESEAILELLNVNAIVIQQGHLPPVVSAAHNRGVKIIEISQRAGQSEGLFDVEGASTKQSAVNPVFSIQASNIALLLLTSGTTSKPKIVPLTHRNLCRSAQNIVTALHLTSGDKCLNIMPLFHVHGLIASILASVTAGASVICSSGFIAPLFYKWLEMYQPTWYTAVPTMHQAIIRVADQNQECINKIHLRFIRSSSSPLSPVFMASLEDIFHAPVIEAYGMTEASHQIASNPLPPLSRKLGSVGLPAGPEVAIMDPNGKKILAAGEHGEIVIRGKNVMLGYRDNPQGNKTLFTEGWLRTGDQGYFDDDGYLFINGRLKELINRGGEKISPREVDEAFLKHPSVSQAVTFAIPNEDLGEILATAVVLRDAAVSEIDLKRFVSGFLAPFKVPEVIVIRDEIPIGPTGKPQRTELAKILGLDLAEEKQPLKDGFIIPPRTETEKKVMDIWLKVLNLSQAGVNQQFRHLGGDSMLATLVQTRIEEDFKINIPLIDLYAANTISAQADLITRLLEKEVF